MVSDPAAVAGTAGDLLTFLDAAPSPYHAVSAASARLQAAGFRLLDERASWPSDPGGYHVIRGGALAAWVTGGAVAPPRRARLVGAHTDSPNLRLKPHPDLGRDGWRQLGVEVYGGALWNSWLDRDLGLSGRVVVDGADGPEVRLVLDDRPLARIPQLAIHLDRDVNGGGLKLDPQHHLAPVWGLGTAHDGDLLAHVATLLDVAPERILGSDLMLHDVTRAALVGVDRSMISSARLDNLLSCWAAVAALVERAVHAPDDTLAVVALFDHEEVGSQSSTGADGAFLPTVLERATAAAGHDRDAHLRLLADTICVSADGAHATHPNYADRHEPAHHIRPDGGPVLKHNANVRYATTATGTAEVRRCAAAVGVPLQEFVVRTDLPCGSTIGPVTAARLGIEVVDIGVAQLAMHSARELCGAADAERFMRLLTAFVAG